jgi:glyoxylase-like metal-dependent hydrolase (beta-lactamase superfamily II)
MIIKRISTGMLGSNCYIIGGRTEGIVIDPGVRLNEIVDEISKLGLKIEYILLTHSHIDHILSVDKLRQTTGAKVGVHELDASALDNERLNSSRTFGLNYKFEPADVLLKDGDRIEVDGLEIEIIHTPGHTPGGICIKIDKCLFSGDTLFRMSIGRTDFGNGDSDDLLRSINEKLMKLDDSVIVYPGHGTMTTIGFERKNNIYITG